MVERIKRINNPLTIIGMFAALAEISSTVVIGIIDKNLQYIFIWFKLDKLSSLEQIGVFLDEEPIVGANKPRLTTIQFSDDGSTCIVKIPFTLYYRSANKPMLRCFLIH